MTKDNEDSTAKTGLNRWIVAPLGVAAIGIAVAVWVSNGGGSGGGAGTACAVQPQVAAAIDAVAQGELAALTPTALGRGYGDLAFADDTGRPMSLADFSGTPLLVNFWATWCVPCREEMPALNALAARYDVEDFQIVTVNLDLGEDGAIKAQKFLEEEGLDNLALYTDSSFEAFERLKREAVAIGLPATLLVDEEGCEIAVLQGPAEWNSDDAVAVVDALIDATGA